MKSQSRWPCYAVVVYTVKYMTTSKGSNAILFTNSLIYMTSRYLILQSTQQNFLPERQKSSLQGSNHQQSAYAAWHVSYIHNFAEKINLYWKRYSLTKHVSFTKKLYNNLQLGKPSNNLSVRREYMINQCMTAGTITSKMIQSKIR